MSTVGLVGSLSRDVVGGAPGRVGGAVYYATRALVAVAADARVAARCTEADRETLLAPLEALGLPVAWRPAAAATSFAFHYVDEHRVMDVASIGDPWTPADVTGWVGDALGEAMWIHVGALLRSDFPRETLTALAYGGRRLLVDGQGLVRRARVGPLELEAPPADLLEPVSILKLGEREAQVLAGGTDVASLRALGVPEVLLTLGSRGSLVVTDTEAEHIPTRPLVDVDPTGAGDVLAAAYLAARAAGSEPVAAARSAAQVTHDVLAAR
jgi:1D-myo-inositol 3-kinase